MLRCDSRRRAVVAGRTDESPYKVRRDLLEEFDAVTDRDEPAEPVEQLHDPREALTRQRTTGRELALNATDDVGKGLFPLLRMLAHAGTSHTGTGHGPGGVSAPAGAI
jgi:hypothetical protein